MNAADHHIRYVPGDLAAAMVEAGTAEIAHQNGKVRSVRLIPSSSLVPIGPPSGGWLAPRFCVREKLDGGGIVWRHHPRATYEPPE